MSRNSKSASSSRQLSASQVRVHLFTSSEADFSPCDAPKHVFDYPPAAAKVCKKSASSNLVDVKEASAGTATTLPYAESSSFNDDASHQTSPMVAIPAPEHNEKLNGQDGSEESVKGEKLDAGCKSCCSCESGLSSEVCEFCSRNEK